MLTKKAKLERFDDIQRYCDLLERYFWDTRDDPRNLRKWIMRN
jgi:hypothetical protein